MFFIISISHVHIVSVSDGYNNQNHFPKTEVVVEMTMCAIYSNCGNVQYIIKLIHTCSVSKVMRFGANKKKLAEKCVKASLQLTCYSSSFSFSFSLSSLSLASKNSFCSYFGSSLKKWREVL
mmetsp:Transcript_26287/g.44350  ORF Transcript_26287/g.44350 Transcript_26287/m.44350 type:complete len:122 (+) Transcript_26287:1526-1891(+)